MVLCLNFDSNVLASGSVDTTVKVWNFRTGEAFTLHGHRDWVNSVWLWDTGEQASPQVGESMACGSSGEPKIRCPLWCSDGKKWVKSHHGMASLDDMEQADQALLRKSIASLAIRNSPRESHTRTQPRHAISPSRPWLRVH
jgi:WD40 repeat protein